MLFKSSERPKGRVSSAKNYINKLLLLVEHGKVGRTAVITHDLPLVDTPKGYHLMESKEGNAIKVAHTP
ncbi:MAG TPA: hypothetical protein VNN20_03470 [Thermodesulfobacteriota bacterium]|nr:hypothetical protein [Thermodesulfobacteriota bacterium]